jgi:hypothetical protein
MVAIAHPNHRASSVSSQGIPLILQKSSLPGSSDPDEFFYNPYASLESRDFAAARAFFIHHGHIIVYHDCPNAMAFQGLYPSANTGYISLLPKGLLAEGRRILESRQRALLRASASQATVSVQAPPPSCLLDPSSIVMWSRAPRALQLIIL